MWKEKVKVVPFGIRGSSGEERGSLLLSLSYGRVVELRARLAWSLIVFRCYKRTKLFFNSILCVEIVVVKLMTNLWEIHNNFIHNMKTFMRRKLEHEHEQGLFLWHEMSMFRHPQFWMHFNFLFIYMIAH